MFAWVYVADCWVGNLTNCAPQKAINHGIAHRSRSSSLSYSNDELVASETKEL